MNRETSLAQASALYLASLPAERRTAHQVELNRFVRWCGSDRLAGGLRIQEISNYAQVMAASGGDLVQRLEPARLFLLYLKQQKLASVNLAVHLKGRKGSSRQAAASPRPAPKVHALTPQGYAQVEAELATLKAERPQVVDDIRRAAADKDFRENAPLDAARERQAYLEGRIQKLEATLRSAASGRAQEVGEVGARLVLRDLDQGGVLQCTLVAPSEADPRMGRISVASPLGQALRRKGVGEVVEVAAPAGRLRYLIEALEA